MAWEWTRCGKRLYYIINIIHSIYDTAVISSIIYSCSLERTSCIFRTVVLLILGTTVNEQPRSSHWLLRALSISPHFSNWGEKQRKKSQLCNYWSSTLFFRCHLGLGMYFSIRLVTTSSFLLWQHRPLHASSGSAQQGWGLLPSDRGKRLCTTPSVKPSC